MMGADFKKESDEAYAKYALPGETINVNPNPEPKAIKSTAPTALKRFMDDFKLTEIMTPATLLKIYDVDGDGIDQYEFNYIVTK